jgi:hypothetical protein
MRAGLLSLATGVLTFGGLVTVGVITWRMPTGDIGGLIVFALMFLTLPMSLLAGLQVYYYASGRHRLQHELSTDHGYHDQALDALIEIRTPPIM